MIDSATLFVATRDGASDVVTVDIKLVVAVDAPPEAGLRRLRRAAQAGDRRGVAAHVADAAPGKPGTASKQDLPHPLSRV